jgi:hypothetical protein
MLIAILESGVSVQAVFELIESRLESQTIAESVAENSRWKVAD